MAVVVVAAAIVLRQRGGDAASDDDTVEVIELWSRRAPALADLEVDESVHVIAAAGEVVVLAARRSDGPLIVVALDRATGEQRWDVDVEMPAPGGTMSILVGGSVVISTPGDDGDVARSGRLLAVDAATGERLWFRDDLVAPETWTATGGVVMALTDESGVVGLDAATGDELWTRTGDRATLPLVVRANGVVFVDRDPDAAAVEVTGMSPEGEERWTRRADADARVPDWRPGEHADVVAMFDGDRITGIDLETGDERWSVPLEQPTDMFGRLVATDGSGVAVACTETETDTESETESMAMTVVGLDDGVVRWSGPIEGDRAGFRGLTGGAVLISDGDVGPTGCAAFGPGPVGRITARSHADGATLWQAGDGDATGLLTGLVAGPVVDVQALTYFASGTQTAIDLETGVVLGEGSRDDGVRSLVRVGDSVVALRGAGDDEWSVVDAAAGATGERAVAVPAPAVPIGYADGVLFVRSGSKVTAID